MKSLVRRKYGPFSIDNSISLDELEQSRIENNWQRYIYPIDSVLLHLKAIVVNDNSRQAIQHGRPIDNTVIDTHTSKDQSQSVECQETHCRAYGLDGHFLGILRYTAETGQWQPEKVFI
jgi:tRNA U55 pseudouridine synthase TruB